jgi:hypothetical protein
MKLSNRIILPLFFSPVCFKIYIAAIFQASLHITQRNRMFFTLSYITEGATEKVLQFTMPLKSILSLKLVQEKTCFQNKSKFITEDYFVQHTNITIK